MKLEVNLLPPEALQRRRPDSRRVVRAVLWVGIGFALAYVAVLLFLRNERLASDIASDEVRIAALRPAVRQYAALAAKLAQPSTALPAAGVVPALGRITGGLPTGVTLDTVDDRAGAATLTGVAQDAAAFAAFLRALEALPGGGGLHLDQVTQGPHGVRFQITLTGAAG